MDKNDLEKEIFGHSDEEDDQIELSDVSFSSDEEDESDKRAKLKSESKKDSAVNDDDEAEKVELADHIVGEHEDYITKPLPNFKKKRASAESTENKEKSEDTINKKKSKKKKSEGDQDEDGTTPNKKKKRDGKPQKDREEEDDAAAEGDEANLDPEEAKLREARRDVDAALSKIKPKKQKKDLIEETDIDEMIQILIQKMGEAARTDEELNKYKQPAIAKLKLLPVVEEQLSKRQLGEQFLDNGVLEVIKVWLEPCRPDGLFPVLDIQRSMLNALNSLNIHTLHLRESGVGKIIKFYSKYSDIPDIKKIATRLVDKWMRPIINRSDKYKDRHVAVAEYDIVETQNRGYQEPVRNRTLTTDADGKETMSTGLQHRARIPVSVAPNFDIAPKSIISHSGDRSKGADPYRKLKNKMMMMKRKAV